MCRSFESSLEPSLRRVTELHANLRVPARVYDVEGGAIFAKNSTFVFFDGFAWTPRLRSPSPIMAPGNVHRFSRPGSIYSTIMHYVCNAHAYQALNLIKGIWTGDKKHSGMKKYLLHSVHMKVIHVVIFNHFFQKRTLTLP